MNETLSLIKALAVGGTLGMLFFAGLWWTTRHGVSSECPALWFFSSLLLRTVMVLTGFHCVARDSTGSLLMCLSGFFIAHHIVIWLTRTAEKQSFLTQEF